MFRVLGMYNFGVYNNNTMGMSKTLKYTRIVRAEEVVAASM